MRVFLDTNVLISGFTNRVLCEDVLREVLASHDLTVTYEKILHPSAAVIGRREDSAPDLPQAPLSQALQRVPRAVLRTVFHSI
jgi:predicted nucleic acid-binding protein